MAQREGVAPLAARPAPTLSTSSFAVSLIVFQPPLGKALCSRKTALLTQSCPLCSVTLTPTYRHSLISPLQGIINALPTGSSPLESLSIFRYTKKIRVYLWYPRIFGAERGIRTNKSEAQSLINKGFQRLFTKRSPQKTPIVATDFCYCRGDIFSSFFIRRLRVLWEFLSLGNTRDISSPTI